MTRPRSALISLEATPYYHCIARCVRRAFLCGKDSYSGRDFNHRKPWLLRRIKLLAEVFAIDISAYAVMSNHYHLVVHVDKTRSKSWSQEEVIARWTRLYKGPELVQRFILEKSLTESEMQAIHDVTELWRSRLNSISWFMSCLNHHIALQANKEDGCKGRFWEGRFKSQALLDEAALLSCMAYVDLNPVRAGIADNLNESDFTSIQNRIRQLQGRQQTGRPRLMPFAEVASKHLECPKLPCHFKDYLELVDWTGRIIRNDKKGYIKERQPQLLKALGLSGTQWCQLTLEIQKQAISMLHGVEKLAAIENRAFKVKAG